MSDWQQPARPLRRKDIEALLAFLPVFSADGFSAGSWYRPPGSTEGDAQSGPEYFELSPEAVAFMDALYKTRWMYPFDWSDGDWQKRMFAMLDDPSQMAKTDLETLRQMLISYARADRFCEGAWAEAFEAGHIRAILERLQQITMKVMVLASECVRVRVGAAERRTRYQSMNEGRNPTSTCLKRAFAGHLWIEEGITGVADGVVD